MWSLFDHLVGTRKQLGRHGQPERLRRLEVDHQFEPRRLLDWQIGRHSASCADRLAVAELAGIARLSADLQTCQVVKVTEARFLLMP